MQVLDIALYRYMWYMWFLEFWWAVIWHRRASPIKRLPANVAFKAVNKKVQTFFIIVGPYALGLVISFSWIPKITSTCMNLGETTGVCPLTPDMHMADQQKEQAAAGWLK